MNLPKLPLPVPTQTVPRAIGLALVVILIPSCSSPVKVQNITPLAPAGLETIPSTMGTILDTVRDAHDQIARGDQAAISIYNFAVARLLEELESSGSDPWSNPIATPGAVRTTSLKGVSPPGVTPLAAKLNPTDTLSFSGKDGKHASMVAGVGAPLVVVNSLGELGHREVRKKMPIRNLTAIVSFDRGAATLELLDPLEVAHVTLGGRKRTLAADFGAEVMLALSTARVDTLGLVRLLRPYHSKDTIHLNFLQPYDQDRIPVLLVHGLDSTPATWAPLYFELLKDAEIRRRYQFWVFSYPSGYPSPYSGALLRRELNDVQKDFPDHQNMVINGHSMGSMITRLMVTDAEDKLWRTSFGGPVEETAESGRSGDLLKECLVFRNRPEIKRAVFFSGPHRGSEFASNWIGRFGSKLVRLPAFMGDVRDSATAFAAMNPAAMGLNSTPNSIDTLSPNNGFILAINKIPIAPGVTYHTIVGDYGKGNTPDSSDGVIPYWSSHLEGAASEKIVPSGHGSHAHPEGIEEARRILNLHLKEKQ